MNPADADHVATILRGLPPAFGLTLGEARLLRRRLDFGRSTRFSSMQGQMQHDIEVEIRWLRLELKQTMDLYISLVMDRNPILTPIQPKHLKEGTLILSNPWAQIIILSDPYI